jgi:hypothetical protein
MENDQGYDVNVDESMRAFSPLGDMGMGKSLAIPIAKMLTSRRHNQRLTGPATDSLQIPIARMIAHGRNLAPVTDLAGDEFMPGMGDNEEFMPGMGDNGDMLPGMGACDPEQIRNAMAWMPGFGDTDDNGMLPGMGDTETPVRYRNHFVVRRPSGSFQVWKSNGKPVGSYRTMDRAQAAINGAIEAVRPPKTWLSNDDTHAMKSSLGDESFMPGMGSDDSMLPGMGEDATVPAAKRTPLKSFNPSGDRRRVHGSAAGRNITPALGVKLSSPLFQKSLAWKNRSLAHKNGLGKKLGGRDNAKMPVAGGSMLPGLSDDDSLAGPAYGALADEEFLYAQVADYDMGAINLPIIGSVSPLVAVGVAVAAFFVGKALFKKH